MVCCLQRGWMMGVSRMIWSFISSRLNNCVKSFFGGSMRCFGCLLRLDFIFFSIFLFVCVDMVLFLFLLLVFVLYLGFQLGIVVCDLVNIMSLGIDVLIGLIWFYWGFNLVRVMLWRCFCFFVMCMLCVLFDIGQQVFGCGLFYVF